MSEAFSRTARELEVWNGALVQATCAIMRSAAALRARPLAEGQAVNRRALTVELIETVGDAIEMLAMTADDFREEPP